MVAILTPLSDTERAAAIERAVAYLHGRQSPAGGFCVYRSAQLDEPNLFDTYYAVAALHMAGGVLPRPEAIRRFLCEAEPVQVYGLYFRSFALQLLGQDDPVIAATRAAVVALPLVPPRAESLTSGKLRSLLFTLRLKRLLDAPLDMVVAARLRALEHAGGGFGGKPNAIDTHLTLACLAACGDQVPMPRTDEFLQRLQHPAFGFRLTEDSLAPALDTLYAGVQACRLRHVPVAYPAAVARFVLDCQTANGGFARAPMALPGIELTCRALALLLPSARPAA